MSMSFAVPIPRYGWLGPMRAKGTLFAQDLSCFFISVGVAKPKMCGVA